MELITMQQMKGYDNWKNNSCTNGQAMKYNDTLLTEVDNWLNDKAFNIFATLRSFRTPITASNMSKMMYNAINSISTIDGLYYTVEGDRYSKNTHAHLLISGIVDRKEFAKTIKRSATKELCYWEEGVNDVSGAIIYSTKKIKNKSDVIHDYGYINRDSAVDECVEQMSNKAYWDEPTFNNQPTEEKKKIDANYKMLQSLSEHPNKKYHDRHQLYSQAAYGWKKSKLGR
jgi:hypothetical protein